MNSGMKAFIVALLLVAIGTIMAMKQKRADQGCGSTCSCSARAATTLPASGPAEEKNLPRVVDIGAGTCLQCKKMAAVLGAFAKEFAGRVEVEMVDTRTDEQHAQLYGYRLIPTQILFDATGKELFRHEGFFSREDILAKFKESGVELAGATVVTTQPGV